LRAFIARWRRQLIIGAAVMGSVAFDALGVAFVVLANTPPTAEPSYAEASSVGSSLVATVEASVPSTLSPHGAHLDAYEGLASWVDIYEARAWRSPSAAVADMAAHGVRTLFIETGNASEKAALVRPSKLSEFVRAAHAHNMFVVGWYLPNLRAHPKDFNRSMAAITFTTSDGQRFDSFALDIESDAVHSASKRSRAVIALSEKIRRVVGPTYPLGAIIPSPVALSSPNGPWGHFPYSGLARTYDVFLPMGYYTFHVHGASRVYRETRANVRILRSHPGCADVAVHIIGGIAQDTSSAEVRQFVRASNESGCIGASLYSWSGTRPSLWTQLASVASTAAP